MSQDGGARFGRMYYFWPYLRPGSIWDAGNLPESSVKIAATSMPSEVKEIEPWSGAENVHVDHHNLIAVPIDSSTNEFYILNGNDGGVAYSRNGGKSFNEGDAFQGYNTSQFYDATKRFGHAMYFGGTQDNGTWLSGNNPDRWSGWKQALGADGFDVIWKGNGDSLIGSIQFNQFYRSLDGGQTWNPAVVGMSDISQFLTSLSTSVERPDVVFTIGYRGIWRSRDFADSWELIQVDSGLWGFGREGGKVRVSLANPDVIWAGYWLRNRISFATLHVSRDGGDTFSPVPSPSIAPATAITGLATHPWQAQTAYVTFSVYGHPKVLRTTDYGMTWEDLSGFAFSPDGQSTNGFPDAHVYDLEVFPERGQIIWAGTDLGLFESRDHGKTWQYADNGLPSVSVWRIRIKDDEVIIATHGRGVWSLDLSEVLTNADPVADLPAQFLLEPNYPNPFNPTTTIGFQVPQESHVRLTVFDVLGRKVATLVDRPYPAGKHRADWNGANMASGQYFYRMEADGQLIQTHSMVLVK